MNKKDILGVQSGLHIPFAAAGILAAHQKKVLRSGLSFDFRPFIRQQAVSECPENQKGVKILHSVD